MLNLLEKMFKKRFCVSVDTDIELYENGSININPCLCGHYNHVSCILQGNLNFEKARILSFGVNHMGDSDGIKPGVHAEHDAINKLQPLKHKKKLESINLLVVRLSTKNKLQSSKPCFNCIEMMKFLPITKGYKIHNIYYSDGEENIVKISLQKLETEEKHYSKYYKRRNIKNKVKENVNIDEEQNIYN
jgi:hypothetical protein